MSHERDQKESVRTSNNSVRSTQGFFMDFYVKTLRHLCCLYCCCRYLPMHLTESDYARGRQNTQQQARCRLNRPFPYDTCCRGVTHEVRWAAFTFLEAQGFRVYKYQEVCVIFMCTLDPRSALHTLLCLKPLLAESLFLFSYVSLSLLSPFLTSHYSVAFLSFHLCGPVSLLFALLVSSSFSQHSVVVTWQRC